MQILPYDKKINVAADLSGVRDGKRLDFIDALRGFAALYVVIFHMTLVPDFKMPVPQLIAPIVANGHSGVMLFFVISAFTLCYTLSGKALTREVITSFYIRRIFRIVPLYYVWLFGMYVVRWEQDVFGYIRQHYSEFFTFALFGYNFVPGRQEGLVWASWTLGVEMLFYIFFPILFRLCNNLKKSLIFFAVSLLISFAHQHFTRDIQNYNSFYGILNHLPVFMVGIICFYIYQQIKNGPVSRKTGHLLTLAAFAFFLVSVYYPGFGYPLQHIYIMALIYGCLLIGLSISSYKVLLSAASVFIGTISYSVYLNHPKFVKLSGDFYQSIFELPIANSLSFVLCVLVTLVPLIAISFISYSIIEKPGMQIGKYIILFIKNRNQKKDGSLVAQR